MHRSKAASRSARLLLGRGAADIEEVGGRAAMHLDDVHRGHGQPRAVDHAADVAVEADVVEVVRLARHLAGVDLRVVAQRKELLLPERRIVVEAELGVRRDELALRVLCQRVDLRTRLWFSMRRGSGMRRTSAW